MGQFYCRTHRREYDHDCPSCQADQAEEDRQSIIDHLSELTEARADELDAIKEQLESMEFKRANPGDYECPECLYVSLKANASRCPTCHAQVSQAHWQKVWEKREAEALVRAQKKAEADEKARVAAAAKHAAEEKEATFGCAATIFVLVVLIALGVRYADSIYQFFQSKSLARPQTTADDSKTVLSQGRREGVRQATPPVSRPEQQEQERREPRTSTLLSEARAEVLAPITITANTLLGAKILTIDHMFTRKVSVNRQRSPQEVLNLPKWSRDIAECQGYEMPTNDTDDTELTFFMLPKDFYINELRELEEIYEKLGLSPDPYALAALNEQDPSFSQHFPNMVQWRVSRGGSSVHLKFRHSTEESGLSTKKVYCGSFTLGWSYKYDHVQWWYAGTRKQY